MNRIESNVSPRSRLNETSAAVAVFDLRGKMILASNGFSALVGQRVLAEELLTIPRALALRAACGYAPDTLATPADRRFLFRGCIYRLRCRFVEASGQVEPSAIALEVVEETSARIHAGATESAVSTPAHTGARVDTLNSPRTAAASGGAQVRWAEPRRSVPFPRNDSVSRHSPATSPPRRKGRTTHGGKMLKISRFAPLLPIGLVLLAACQDTVTEPEGEPYEPQEALAPTRESLERPHEAVFHQVSRELKSYGGHFLDEEGNLVAYLGDPGEQELALTVLGPILEKHPFSERQRRGEVVFRKADFTFPQLAEWRDRATDPVLELKEVEYTDLDEAQNRLVIGVSGPRGKEAAARAVAEQKVPLEAVVFEETTPVRDLVSLRDYRRPIEGGLQIGSGVGTCTMGFNAYWSGIRGFLTNSHCTTTFWGNDGGSFYQNASPNYVGYEIRDPGAHSCGIFGIFQCRWSDAALVRTTASVTSNHGYIARTTSWATGDGNSGSITINNSNPRMRITGEYSFPVGGEMFDKMGRTTGWTYGWVAKTCVDVNKSGLRRVRCQDYVKKLHAAPGDSGSPVFRWHGNTVTLAGILWGGINQGGTQYTIISAMWNIEKDIGALSTF